MGTVNAEDPGPFVYNKGFRELSDSKKGWFIDGYTTFTGETYHKDFSAKPDTSFRTCFGPCVCHNGVILRDNNHNQNLGIRRLTLARGSVTQEQCHRVRQTHFILNHQTFLEGLADLYSSKFMEYVDMEDEAEKHHADPHPKKMLRVQAWEDLNEDWTRFDETWLPEGKKTVLYKCKKDEIAKTGKVIRMIGDLGVSASLQGFVITDLLKKAMATNDYDDGDTVLHFCASPTQDGLREVFSNLISPPSRVYFCLFSDDSCVSIRANGQVYTFNVDISKCDASHSTQLFAALVALTPPHCRGDMDRLVAQCKLPIRVHNRADKKEYVILKPSGPRLYSGSTLTTVINNLANLLIGKSISEQDYDGKTHSEVQKTIVQAAKEVGYIVTCEPCPDYSCIQFLKHSPAYDVHGKLQPLLNLGVILRMSGTCRRELPGRGDYTERAKTYQAQLLQGASPFAHYPMIDNMKKAAGKAFAKHSEKRISESLRYKVQHLDGDVEFTISEEESFRRYRNQPEGLDRTEELEVLEFSHGAVYQHFASDGLEKILRADYNLSCLG